jgi:hypothetical protein
MTHNCQRAGSRRKHVGADALVSPAEHGSASFENITGKESKDKESERGEKIQNPKSRI